MDGSKSRRLSRLGVMVSAILGAGALLLGVGVLAELSQALPATSSQLPILYRNTQSVATVPTPVVTTVAIGTIGTTPGAFLGSNGFIQFCSGTPQQSAAVGCGAGASVSGNLTVTTSQNAPSANSVTTTALNLLPVSITIQQTGAGTFGSVLVCLPYTASQAAAAGGLDELRLVQVASNGSFTDITQFSNTTDSTICGFSTSLGTTNQVAALEVPGQAAFTLGSYQPILPTTRVAGKIGGIWTANMSTADGSLINALGTGVGWTRITFDWTTMQPSGPTFDANQIAVFDAAVIRARAAGTRNRNVLIQIRIIPSWAQAGSGSNCNLNSASGYQNIGTLANQLAARYAADPQQVLYFQFFNEQENTDPTYQPGIVDCFGTKTAGGVATSAGRNNYADMLNVIGPRLRAANPNAKIVLGGAASGNLSGADETVNCPGGNPCIFDRLFMKGVIERLIATNGLANLDFVAAHYYSGQADQNPNPPAGAQPTVPFNPAAWSIFGGVDLIGRVSKWRQDMLDAGLTLATLKPMLIDEGSFQSCFDSSYYVRPGATLLCNQADWQRLQRNYLVKAFTRAAYLDVAAYLWFRMDDNPTPVPIGTAPFDSTNDYPYGLTTNAGVPKESYEAFRRFAQAIPNAGAQFFGRVQAPTTSPFASTVGGNSEGYEFINSPVCLSTERLRVTWYQLRDSSTFTETTPITIPGAIGEVWDWKQVAVAFSGNTVNVGMDPLYVCYTPS